MSFCLGNEMNITWQLEDMNFIFLCQKKNNILHTPSALVCKILFCHLKIKFVSSGHHVISPLDFFPRGHSNKFGNLIGSLCSVDFSVSAHRHGNAYLSFCFCLFSQHLCCEQYCDLLCDGKISVKFTGCSQHCKQLCWEMEIPYQ